MTRLTEIAADICSVHSSYGVWKGCGERLTWAEDDPKGRADADGADSVEGSVGGELEGAAGGNGEDTTPTLCGAADTGKGGFEGAGGGDASCCCPGNTWGTLPPSITW